MKIAKLFFSLIVLSIMLAACGTSVPETNPPVVDAPVTEAVPTSAPEAEKSIPDTLPMDTEAVQSEEQAVLSSFPQPVTAKGESLVLYGHVLDASGAPLAGYAVEIWQVDLDGIYDHPGDSDTTRRDMGFQFYGTAVTDANGLFAFRTIIPGFYEPRPRHIHFKVKKDGQTILTSQFYFVEDVNAAQLGTGGEMILLDPTNAQDANENPMKMSLKNIVVNTGSGGNLSLTPSQGEGPYYPVVDVAQFDNDLANVQ